VNFKTTEATEKVSESERAAMTAYQIAKTVQGVASSTKSAIDFFFVCHSSESWNPVHLNRGSWAAALKKLSPAVRNSPI
jgi:hypothetical protein